MKVFISGVAGLLGSNVANHLLNQGIKVVGVDNLIGGIKENIIPQVDYHNFDILDTAKLKEVMEGCEIAFHAAALPYEGLSVFSPKLCVESIVSGTVSMASAAIATGVRRFINCSSMARYGQGQPPFMETHKTNPVDPYGLAKVQAEQQLALLNKIHGLNYTTIVPHNVIGVGQRYNAPFRNVVAIMISRVLMKQSIIIYGDGQQTRSFSNVKDCVDAIWKIMISDRDLCGQVYNIGPDDNEITIERLAKRIGHHAEIYPTLEYFPDRPTEVKNAYCSSYKIRKEFNYNAAVPLDQTLKEMMAWIKPRMKPFEYHLPIEIENENTPQTWKDKLI